jgi:hypothetical protein
MSLLEKDPPVMRQAAQQVWQHRLKRSGYFVAALLLHLILFSLIATWVIFRGVTPPPDARRQLRARGEHPDKGASSAPASLQR